MAQKYVENKIPIYKLKKTDEVMKYYDEWGEENKYDKDIVAVCRQSMYPTIRN